MCLGAFGLSKNACFEFRITCDGCLCLARLNKVAFVKQAGNVLRAMMCDLLYHEKYFLHNYSLVYRTK